MSTKTNTKPLTLAAPKVGDVVKAWQAADDAAESRSVADGRGIKARLTIGAYLLTLDAKHGASAEASKQANAEAAQKANDEAREVIREAYPVDKEGNTLFRWDKSRASQARNLARGTGALMAKGIDPTGDTGTLKSLGSLAAVTGVAGIADAVDTIAAKMNEEGADLAKVVRDVTREVRQGQAPSAFEATLETLKGTVSILDAFADDEERAKYWPADLTADEAAALKAIVTRLGALAGGLVKSL